MCLNYNFQFFIKIYLKSLFDLDDNKFATHPINMITSDANV